MLTDDELWQPIATGPHNATWVLGKMADGTEQRVHWASDLSGSDQPAFQGWFCEHGPMFVECHPTHWRPISEKRGEV